MTAKESKALNFRVTDESDINTIKSAMELHNIKGNKEFMETAINLLPLLNVIQAKGLTIEQASERLNRDENIVTIVQTVRKGANDKPFDLLLNQIMNYNLECKEQQFKIALTPSIFYKIIGGNVKAIQALFETNIEAIDKHNADMGLDDNWNRKLAKRVDTDLYSWIKKTVGYNA